MPPEVQIGGSGALMDSLQSPSARDAMKKRMETGRDFANIIDLVGFSNVCVTGLREKSNQLWEGCTLSQIAKERNCDPYDTLFDLLQEEACGVSMIDYLAKDTDMQAILKAPFSGLISDVTSPVRGLIHSRVYVPFTRVLET